MGCLAAAAVAFNAESFFFFPARIKGEKDF